MNLNNMNKVIEMTKGPATVMSCFLAHYLRQGIVSYKGERDTDRLGTL